MVPRPAPAASFAAPASEPGFAYANRPERKRPQVAIHFSHSLGTVSGRPRGTVRATGPAADRRGAARKLPIQCVFQDPHGEIGDRPRFLYTRPSNLQKTWSVPYFPCHDAASQVR